MIRLKSARRGKDVDPKFGSDDILVLRYEVKHWASDTPAEKGSVLTLDVVVKVDEATRTVTPSLRIRDVPAQESVAAALAKLGRWCTRLGEELERASHSPHPAMMVPTLLEKKDR